MSEDKYFKALRDYGTGKAPVDIQFTDTSKTPLMERLRNEMIKAVKKTTEETMSVFQFRDGLTDLQRFSFEQRAKRVAKRINRSQDRDWISFKLIRKAYLKSIR